MSRASTPTSRPVPGGGIYRLPEHIGPYTIRAQVGWGGTAFTFIGSEPGPFGAARLKLLKIPSPQLLFEHSPAEVRELFQNEARILERLHPTNIAPLERVLELGDHEGMICLVYTFIAGVDLARFIRLSYANRELMPWESVVGLLRDIAGALDEAHTDHRGRAFYKHGRIVHRDVSPSNIMLDFRGRGWLVDFGFARFMPNSKLQASRAHPGRIAYSAPEYFADNGGVYDPRLDLFALGAVAFEALTGRPAFTGKDIQSHLEQVRAKQRPKIRNLRPEFLAGSVDPELEALVGIVNCLLEPDPDDRFQQASALLSAVTSLRVRVDPRPLAAMVLRHQTPLQHRVTEGRIDRGAVMERVHADQRISGSTAAELEPPEEVLVELAAAEELERIAPPKLAPGAGVETYEDPSLIERMDELLAEHAGREHEDHLASPLPVAGDFTDTRHNAPVIPATRGSAEYEAPGEPWIPETSPTREAPPHVDAQEPSGVHSVRPHPLVGPATPPASGPSTATLSSAASPSTPASSPSTKPRLGTAARADLPAFADLDAIRRRHGRADKRQTRAAIVLTGLLVGSLFVLGTVNTLWVPLVTGQLGWTIVNAFWTPFFTRLGMVGVVISIVGGVILGIRARRRRREELPPTEGEQARPREPGDQ